MKKKKLKDLKINDFLTVIPESDIKYRMYANDFKKFEKFMRGQTGLMGCKGEPLYYVYDMGRFLKGLPIID